MHHTKSAVASVSICAIAWLVTGAAAPATGPRAFADYNSDIQSHSRAMLEEGRNTFRYDTFGSEAFWGGTLQLHKAIAGEKNGGVGPGVSPKTALAVGLKVDSAALPAALVKQIEAGKVNLDDPATTIALLKLNAVVGVKAFTNPDGSVRSMGITCALCHSTVDNSFAPGIGRRRDGWANRDLNVGAIVALAPNLAPFTETLHVDAATVRKVLASWGPGHYDAYLDKDGKAFAPGGKSAATLIPPAFGLAGVNLATWTGAGSVTYWNAYVGVTQMHGQGTFIDRHFDDATQFPVSARTRTGDVRSNPDLVTAKLAALHFYQLAMPAPKAPDGSFDKAAFERGKKLFNGPARCSACHVPPLFTEPGYNMHTPKEIGVDSFEADRSPTHMYRTAPLAGLWTHQKGGFYHDGRFATLMDVVNHYDTTFNLGLKPAQKSDLVEYLKGI